MVEAQTPWLEMGCTSGDRERGLLAPLCLCLTPQGGWRFSTQVNKMHDTHTEVGHQSLKESLSLKLFYYSPKKSNPPKISEYRNPN